MENIKNYKDFYSNIDEHLSTMSIEDILFHWDELEDEERLRLFLKLAKDRRAELVRELSKNHQELLIKNLSAQNTKTLLKEMEPDDLVDFIQNISPEVRSSVWESLSDESRKETEFLLKYDEDDAAGLMTPRYVAVQASITVSQALAFVRRNLEEVETIYYIYVVDQLKRLMGVVSLRELLSAKDNKIIGDIMERDIIFVQDETDQEEVARTLENHDLIAIPVLDKYHRLLGIVTFDDVIDVIREEQTEDIYKMGAMDGNIDPYLDTSLFGLVKKRLPWLSILLIAGLFTANVMDLYNYLSATLGFLFLFVPSITQTGGNCGTQSATLMIRGLATGEVHFKDFGKIVIKELFVGITIGIIMATIMLVRNYFFFHDLQILQLFTISFSLIFVVITSTLIGAMVPLILHKLKFDPTVAAGPLMATVIDVLGLTIYFELNKIILLH